MGDRLQSAVVPNPDAESLSQFIWRTRYRNADARPPELTIGDTWDRVSQSVAATERNPPYWRGVFNGLLKDYQFLPAGRILAGAGTARQVTLANCFVMGWIDDSIPGIFEALKEGALTMQQGGGVGYDFSTLRPHGSRAQATGMVASGPVSFLHVWDAMCATILSTGARRGAMMGTLRCDHPDIEEFIEAKHSRGALTHFNLSVLLTDAFMKAVETDERWPLVFPGTGTRESPFTERLTRYWSGSTVPVVCNVWSVVSARELWRRLCRCARDGAEPGVLFIDRINKENNLAYVERLSATNPCAEEPLPAYGSCNLGSLNLTAFTRAPFTANAHLDYAALRDAARLAVRFLDDVIEISRFPLERQRLEAHATRRIGLGLTGLADTLAMLALPYDSASARDAATAVMRTIRDAAYEVSIELARERGPFPRFDAALYLKQPFIERLPEGIRAGIARYGVRNSHLLAIAPTGTISLLARNVSSGVEPIFQLDGERSVLDEQGEHHTFRVSDQAYSHWRSLKPDTLQRPGAFRERTSVSPRDQLLMLAALQPFVDGGISKTVALPRDIDSSAVDELFKRAYALGLKGCTVFRDQAANSIRAEASSVRRAQPPAGCCDVLLGAH